MLEIGKIIERYSKKLQQEIKDAIVKYEAGEKRIIFEETPTFVISQDIELKIYEKEYKYTISVAMLSGEDQRTEQVKKVLKEINRHFSLQYLSILVLPQDYRE